MKHIHLETVDSTQKEAWRLYPTFTDNELLISSNIQTRGIGTHGRKWYTDKGNIAFSYLCKGELDIALLEDLPYKIALLIKEIFVDIYNIELTIKRPNDLMINDKKVGGILVESRIEKNNLKAIVIGVGINTSQETFNKSIAGIATSIKNEYQKVIDTEGFILEFYKRFTKEILERT